MAFRDVLVTAYRSYLWPAIYAAGAAAIVVAEQELQTGQPFSGQAVLAAAVGAIATFTASRLNPTAGKDQPFIEPHA